MNFEYLNATYCCNCDWLQFSALLENDPDQVEVFCPEGFRLEVLPGNNIFRNRAILWRLDDGEKFLTLLWNPYSRKLKRRLLTCQLANLLLYNDGVTMAYRLLQEITPCHFNSMGRVDICMDFKVSDYELKFIRKLWDGSYYTQGKSEGSEFWHSSNEDRMRFVHCLSWGSKNSEIKVKLYNKVRELGVCKELPMGSKPWIVNEWKMAGWCPKDIWRLEFSMGSAGQLQRDGKSITLDDVKSPSWLLDTFLSLYHSRFKVRENYGLRKGHKNGDPERVLLQLPPSSTKLKWRVADDPQLTTERITLLRKLMSTFDLPIVKTDVPIFETMANSVLQLCETKGMTGYFATCYGDTPESYFDRMYANIGGGCFEVTPSPNMDI